MPVRGSILYFVIDNLAAIDPMYQHSLAYFMQLFTHCIEASARALDLETRLNTLLTFVTNFVFSTVSSGLLCLICTHSQQPASSTTASAIVVLTFAETLLCIVVTCGPLGSALSFIFTAVRPGLVTVPAHDLHPQRGHLDRSDAWAGAATVSAAPAASACTSP